MIYLEGKKFSVLGLQVRNRFTQSPVRLAWVILFSAMTSPAEAERGSLPSIEVCGLTTNVPALPRYELRNVHLPKMISDEKGGYDSEIRMVLPGRGELLLQTYMFEPNPGSDLDRQRKINWDHMAGRKFAVGWLKGATNLLLISWMDLSASHATGHYVIQWYLLARMGTRNNAILLKKSVVSEGRERDISRSSGRGMHYFSYDSLKRELVDTMQFARTMYVGAGDNVPPLFYPAKGGDAEATRQYIADIEETVVHRYQLRAEALKSLGVQ